MKNYQKLHIYPYIPFLVTGAMFFKESKIPTLDLLKIPLGTIPPGGQLFGSIVSEEKIFKDKTSIKQKIRQKGVITLISLYGFSRYLAET